jgi:two-component system CheB/CheR fusion protein
VLDIFAYSLQPTDGYLFLGQAETVRPSKATYELMNKRWKIYRCLNGPLPALSRSASRAVAQDSPDRRPGALRRPASEPADRGPQPAAVSGLELSHLRRFNEWVLRFLPNGVAVIDRTYRIVTINSAARRLLGIHEAGADQDFLHSVRGLPYEQVRSAIDGVFRERNAVALPELEMEPASGEVRYLTLNVVLMYLDAGAPELAVIHVIDVTDQVLTRQRLDSSQREQKQLVAELQISNRRLGEMNKELQDANEELQAANEEMMLTQEELQATNEELEATNEEFQATNEELETNNEELQATNEELETTNEELQARTEELAGATRRLVAERTRLVDMVELAPFYILLLRGPDLRIEAFNSRYAQLLGAREVVNRPLAEIFTDRTQGGLVPIVHEVYRDNTLRTTPRMLVNIPNEHGVPVPRYFVYTIVPTHEAGGKVDGVVLYADDISAQLEHDAIERRENLKLMVAQADQVAVALFEARTARLLQASPRYLDVAERATGYPRAEIIGRRWGDLAFFAATPDDAAALLQSVMDAGALRRLPEVHVRFPHEEETTVWDCSLTPLRFGLGNDDTDEQFLVISVTEITQPVRALQQLKELDRLKDEFISQASHELRTPLVPLRGYADLLKRLIRKQETQPGWDPRIGEYAGKFDQQIRYLNRLIDDLFDATRLRTGKFTLNTQRVDLVGVVAQAVEQGHMLAAIPPIQLTTPGDGAPLMADADPQRIMQVILNLLQNAVKHAPESPVIEVGVRRLPAARRRRTQDAGGEVPAAEITVQDQGPGIPPEVRGSLFTPYYQAPHSAAQKSGLGLGLFIARQIVEQHSGTIDVESTVGEGTTFIVRLPLAPTE